jgi:hypothetical protein
VVGFAHDGLYGLGCPWGIVERDRWDEMMEDMRLSDTVEEVLPNESETSVNCGSSTTDICPYLVMIVRKLRVGMVKIGNCH